MAAFTAAGGGEFYWLHQKMRTVYLLHERGGDCCWTRNDLLVVYMRGRRWDKKESVCVEHCKRTPWFLSFSCAPFPFLLFMFENKFFPRRLRQKSEEAISKRITRFFQPRQQQGGGELTQQQQWMNYDDDSKLEIPDTVIIGENGCWLPNNNHDGDDDAMLHSSSTVPDLSTCASHTTDDEDFYQDDDSSRKMIMQFSSNEEYQSQQKQQLSLAEHVRLVLADAFDVADEQFERERCIISPTTL